MTDYTDDRTLADAVVAQGIGRTDGTWTDSSPMYRHDPSLNIYYDFAFVRDPGVAIALMKKVETGEFVQLENGLWAVGIPLPKTNREATCEHESLCRAITAACIEALTHDEAQDR